jgi:predicted NBD/HSP70 family sugar kinase
MEVGHILLEHDGKLQRWEDFASGSAIVKHFGKRASDIDADDTQTWYIIARNIAIGLIDLIATLTPEVIVLGGGVGSHFDKYAERLQEQLKIYENPMLSIPPVVQAKRAEEAVVYGCYHLARKKYGKRA